jgi:rhodanese-related sulfurtransferase
LNDFAVKLEGGSSANKVILKSGKVIETDFVIIAIGVRPNVDLAQNAGVELGQTGAIKVNNKMQTNFEGIYACGDCAESYSLITNKPVYRPLGSTANKMGRITGDQITGGSLEFKGILGTGIFKVFDMTVAQTGLSEREAIKEGFDVEVCHNIKPDKPEYFHGKEMVIKAVADRKTGRLLGTQIIGKSGVDKRIDVFATAISFGAKAEDLFHLDLAYAPPFSTTKDPVMYTGMILDNAMNRDRKLITAGELKRRIDNAEDMTIIDARTTDQYLKSHVEGAINLPHEKLREAANLPDKEKVVVTYCNKGVTGNAAQNILINKGFKRVYNLSGGHKNYMMKNC